MQSLESLCKVTLKGGEIQRPKVSYLSSEHQTYKVDGKKVCGASTIAGRDPDGKNTLIGWANKMGLNGICTNAFLKHSANIGTMAHKLIELWLSGVSSEDSAGEIYAKYGEHEHFKLYYEYAKVSCKKFFDWQDDNPSFKAIFTEKIFTSKIYGYGGQIDIYGELGGKKILVDIKTGSGIYTSGILQVGGGYEHLLLENDCDVDETYILNVSRDDGVPYEFRRIDGAEYLNGIFCDLLNGYNSHKAYSAFKKTDECKEAQALHDAWLENLRRG